MSISVPTGDSKIDMLLVELTTLVKAHGSESFQVETFIADNQDETWTDRYTGVTHYFSEIASALAQLMGGITNPDPESSDDDDDNDHDPADWWKQPVD